MRHEPAWFVHNFPGACLRSLAVWSDGFAARGSSVFLNCHFAAFLYAPTTCSRAILTVLCLVLRAFVAAGLADFCANAANTFREIRTACHQARRRGADRRAGAIQLDAARHHLHILLVQAFRRAMLASDRAVVAGVDTVLILSVWHIRSIIVLTRSFGLKRPPEFFLCGSRNKW